MKDKSNIIIYEDIDNIYNFDGIVAPKYNFDKSKIIFYTWKNNITDYYEHIYDVLEYDIKTNNAVKIMDLPRGSNCIKYVPKSNCISYIVRDNKLIKDNFEVYNLETGKIEKIINNIDYDEYSWSNDGKSFLYTDYTNGSKIYKYNIINNSSEFLFDGYCPVYSNDNKYIAYFDTGSHNTVLVIKNMKTGGEKRHKQSTTYYFCFSPEGDKIACTRECFLKSKELVIWDFETDEEYTLIDNLQGVSEFDWK